MVMRDVVLMAYAAFDGEIAGRTNFQKKMYFLSLKLKLDFGYEPHYFGPYSYAVANANNELKALGYVVEKVVGGGAVDDRGYGIARHDYKLANDGIVVSDILKKESSAMWLKIEQAANEIKNAGNLNYNELSVAAKAYHILTKEGGKMTYDRIMAVATETFGWEIARANLVTACKFLEKLDMVKTT